MLIYHGKNYGLRYSQVWFPTEPERIKREMQKFTLVQVFHASFDADFCGLRKYCSHWRDFWTTIIPLGLSKEEILQKADPKSCRYEIRKAEKMPYSITVNERLDDSR